MMHCACAMIMISRDAPISITRFMTPSSLTFHNTIMIIHPISIIDSHILACDIVFRNVRVITTIDRCSLFTATD